jgi:enediyne biosynthesis protein E4
VQLSSVNAIAVTDLNKDNKPDLLLGGNLFDFPPQFGRLDGSYGHVLLNAGKGQYKWIEASQSGLSLRGAIKDIKEIKIGAGNKTYFTITQNNLQPAMLQVRQ